MKFTVENLITYFENQLLIVERKEKAGVFIAPNYKLELEKKLNDLKKGVQVWVLKITWKEDIKHLNNKYHIRDFINDLVKHKNKSLLIDYLKFRADFIHEELQELYLSIEEQNPEDVVDALIDIIVVALGTLDCFDVRIDESWRAVHKANMTKEVGVKKERPNPLGLPDLSKPEGWEPPSHDGNHGNLTDNIW